MSKDLDRSELDEAHSRAAKSNARADAALAEMARLGEQGERSREADDDRRKADDVRRGADDDRRGADDQRRAADDVRRGNVPVDLDSKTNPPSEDESNPDPAV